MSPSLSETEETFRALLLAAGYEIHPRGSSWTALRPQGRQSVTVVHTLSEAGGIGASPDPEGGGNAPRTLTVVFDPELPDGPLPQSAASGGAVVSWRDLPRVLGDLLLPGASPGGEGVPGSPAPLPIRAPREWRAERTAGPGDSTLPPDLWPAGEQVIRPRLDQADAMRMAEARLVPLHSTLLLLPHYLFGYVVVGGDGRPRTGPALAAVQALTGHVVFWPPGERELVSSLSVPHQQQEPVLSPGDAEARAREALRERHAGYVDHTEHRGGALIIERRRVPPQDEEITLGPANLVYVPYWVVEGWTGRLVIDAVTGEVLEEDSTPFAD